MSGVGRFGRQSPRFRHRADDRRPLPAGAGAPYARSVPELPFPVPLVLPVPPSPPHTLLALAAAGYGAAAGGLLPRAAYRLAVPPGEPVRSHCPAGHPISGWVGRAECRGCGVGRRPADRLLRSTWSAAVGAMVCAALAYTSGPRPELVVWLLAAPVALLLTAVDVAVYRLPDVLTVPLAAGTAALLGAAALFPAAGGEWRRALLGGVVLAGGYFLLFAVGPRGGLGFGDVKLAATPGVALGWYGWDVLLIGTFAGWLFSAGWGLYLMAVRGAGRRTAMAFGPFMVLGTLVGLLLGGAAG